MVVSHDRYFMDKMVDHLFVFEGEGVLKDIVGNYTEFRKAQIQKARNSKDNKATAEKPEKDEFKEKLISTSSEKRKLSFKEKAEFESLERDLELLEEKKNALTEALLNPENSAKLYEIGQDLGVLVTELESKTDRWLELSEFV